jgi:hypothetical protein
MFKAVQPLRFQRLRPWATGQPRRKHVRGIAFEKLTIHLIYHRKIVHIFDEQRGFDYFFQVAARGFQDIFQVVHGLPGFDLNVVIFQLS